MIESRKGHHVSTGAYSACHLNGIHYQELMRKIHQILANKVMPKLRPDAIVVRGSSGLSVACAIKMFDDTIPFVHVRKETHHHGFDVESLTGSSFIVREYVFLDDLICSGATQTAVQEALPDAIMTGRLLYTKLAPGVASLKATHQTAVQEALPDAIMTGRLLYTELAPEVASLKATRRLQNYLSWEIPCNS